MTYPSDHNTQERLPAGSQVLELVQQGTFQGMDSCHVIICCHGSPSPQASHQVPGLIRLFGLGFALALALIVAIALALALALIVAFTALAVAFAAAL